MKFVPRAERAAWHAKAIEAAAGTDLHSHIDLLLKAKEIEPLAKLVGRSGDDALEAVSAYALEPATRTGGSRGSGSTLGGDAGPKAAGGRLRLAPEAVRAWEQAWVDQPVPRLGGLTPRVAARRPDVRQDLEVLLREIEHGAARRSRLGVAGIDLAALRQELDMPAMSA
jgi:hypothetical protein